MIGVEAQIVFGASTLFTLLYVFSEQDYKRFWGILCSAAWIFLGVLWIFLAQEPMEGSAITYDTIVFSMFFVGVGILFISLVIMQWIGELREKRLGDTGDSWRLP